MIWFYRNRVLIEASPLIIFFFMYAIADSDLVRDSGSERFDGGSCKSHPVLDCSNSVYSSLVPDFSSATENLED